MRRHLPRPVERVWMEGNLKWLRAWSGCLFGGGALAGAAALAPLPPEAFIPPAALVGLAGAIYRFGGLKRGLILPPIWRLPGEGKRLALTFDDGPHPEFTPKILEALERHGVRATFFLLGSAAAAHPGLAGEVAARGHDIGSHGQSHRRLDRLGYRAAAREIDESEAVLSSLGEFSARRLFRPPHGAKSPLLELALRRRGYRMVLWNLSPKDWKSIPPGVVFQRLVDNVAPGTIVLLHDSPNAAKVLPDFLPHMLREGYSFVTVGEALPPLP